MTYKKIQEILRCAQILRCLKSKYLLFFPARRVFRYAGMDVSARKLFESKQSLHDKAYGRHKLS
jgi:hypothetical protein